MLGVESVLAPGQTELRWTTPGGREAAVSGGPSFETWREPYFYGTPEVEGTLVVDHALGWGECLSAALAAAPRVYGVGLVGVVLLLLGWGGIAEATVLAFVLRAVRAASPAWFLDSDALRYHRSALDVLAGGVPDPLWPPGWPLSLSAAYAVLGADPAVGRWLGVLLGTAFVPLVAAAAPFEARVATALLAALSFELVQFSGSLYSEPLFLVLSVAFLLLAARRPGSAGVLGGLAALTRVHALFVVPAVMVALRPSRRALGRGVLGFGVVLVAWGAFGLVRTGHLQPISASAGLNLWIGHGPGATGDWRAPGPPPPEGYGAAAWSAIRAEPGAALGRVVRNVGHLWNASLSDRTLASRPLPLPQVPFFGVVLLAVVGGIRERKRALPACVWLGATTLSLAVFFVPVRYKLALHPALFPLAGVGIVVITARLRAATYSAKARSSSPSTS